MSEPAVDLSGAERREYYPGPVALAAHRSRATIKLAWGPLGTAKTTFLVWRAKAICARAALGGYSARIIFVRDTYRNLIDSTYQTWLHWFPKDTAAGYVSQAEPIEFKLNVGGRYHDIIFRHGQTEQDASMFLSTEYDGILFEEVAPAYIPGLKRISPGIAEGVFDMALSRLTREAKRAAAVRPEMCITCNSPPFTHWASTRIIDKTPEYLEKLNWAHWMFPVSDNAVNLRADYYSMLEMAWEGKAGLIKRFLKGERLPIFVGIPRFNLDALDQMVKFSWEPGFRGFLIPDANSVLGVKLEKNPQGWVRIWTPPTLGEAYVLGADVAEGVDGGDYSAAYVIDRKTLEICAAFHGHLEPELYGQELGKLGALYNNARIGIESNNHGLTALVALRNAGYSAIYYQKNISTRAQHSQRDRMGIMTTGHSKPILIDGVGEYLTERPVIPDADLVGELQSYGVMENGSTAAQEGCWDDRVMALALALYVNKMGGLESIFPALNQPKPQQQEAA